MSDTVRYDDRTPRLFFLAAVVWAVVGMLVGLLIAAMLFLPRLNLAPYLTFGRLRPLHTNAVIFAFCGNIIFAGTYHSMQRLLKTRLFSDVLSKVHFWGWQLLIVAAALALVTGNTQGKEYAELPWLLDIVIAVLWVTFAVNFFGTIAIRREQHLYVAIWFYIATIVAVAILHIGNSMAMPYSWLGSYSAYAGVKDALMQWWYGHNAVAFFLTTPFLGLMYYYLPKAAERPVFSYRLSIMHFWSLVFVYIWAGPHHLHYSAVPEWASTLGMLFSLILWMPSWGGMVNGLFTLRGAWHKLRDDPILKFMVVAVTYYGMATFEGPMMSIKSVNAVSHFTDWTIGHVHAGALGWNAFLSFGILYWVVPRLWKTELYSKKLATTHFWVATVGLILYQVSMWVAGITQWGMWRAFEADGRLVYPDFIETVIAIVPLYWVRLVAAILFFSGLLLLVWNVVKTIESAPADYAVEPEVSAPPLVRDLSAPGRGDAREHVRPRVLPAPARAQARRPPAPRGRPGSVHGPRRAGPGRRLARRGDPDVLQQGEREGDRQREAVHAARGRRPRHLHPRGLLQLPLADGPAVPVRDGAVRRVLEGRRVRLRPPLPVGLEADGAGPAPRRREVPVALARPPHAPARLDDAGVGDAPLPAPVDRPLRHEPHRLQDARAAHRGRALHGRRDRDGGGVRWQRQAKAIDGRSAERRRGRRGLADKEIMALTAYLQRLGTDIRWKRPEPPLPAAGARCGRRVRLRHVRTARCFGGQVAR